MAVASQDVGTTEPQIFKISVNPLKIANLDRIPSSLSAINQESPRANLELNFFLLKFNIFDCF